MIFTVASFVIGLRWGIVGVAAAYACVAIPIAIAFSYVTARTLSVPFVRLASAVRGVFEATSVMLAALVLVSLSLDGASPAARLALMVLLGTFIYIPLCAWRVPLLRVELDGFRRRRKTTAISVAGVADPENL